MRGYATALAGARGFHRRLEESTAVEAEFDEIFSRVKAKGIPYGSGPDHHADGQIYARRGGRGFYFEDPYGHLLEVMTVPETGSEDAARGPWGLPDLRPRQPGARCRARPGGGARAR